MPEIKNVFLEDELQSSYIDYAMSVIIGRAIPEARDGLKPVQRRILYAMYNIKNFHNQPTKKSARIVGEVIGKLHPHGDISIYDSLTHMAQDFAMNHLLVEGQGNMGSIDGDPPAAMRYTEVRLTKLAEEMLADLENETVDFVPNFDNTEIEPVVLPAKVPNLLVNGATGIAVGVATSMPPHNLVEVCDAVIHRLDHKEATVEDLMNIIKGPDFPTGGIAVISQNTENGYKYGRGQLAIKAKAEIKEDKNQIIVTEIPYNVNKSSMIQNMVQLARDKRIVGLKDIRDESDKSGIRIVIDYRSDAEGNQILNMLYRHTQLQVTMPIINLAILGKTLKSLNLLQMINIFIEHRHEVILKRSKHELNVASNRLHIVAGLLVAISNIDDVIVLIKESKETEDARNKLIKKYDLTEKQAVAILDMKLSRLTHLENDSLTNEKKELEETIRYYNGLIMDPAKIDAIIKDETTGIKKVYGRPRKTEIVRSDGQAEMTDEDTISNEKITVILTKSGYVKKLGLESYKEQGRGGKGIIAINLKEGDYTKQVITCNNKDYLIFITNTGRAYWLKAYNVPEGNRYSEGKAIVNLLNLKGEKIITMLNVKDFQKSTIAFLTAKGLVKKTKATLFAHPRSNGIKAITLNNTDEIVDVITYSTEKYLIIATKSGKSIKFEEAELRSIGRSGMGVRGIRLKQQDSAQNIIAASEFGSVLTVTENGYGKITDVNKYRMQGRGGGGVINIKTSDKNGRVARALFVGSEQKIMLISTGGVSITIPVASIRITGRAASGVRLMKLSQGERVVDAILLSNETIVTTQSPAAPG